VNQRYSKQPKSTTAACPGSVMTDNLISYFKTMVFQTEPFTAFGATVITKPIYKYEGLKIKG